ncbi:hypothetical protein COCSUDRAFT_34004 [Coccomyxa subellipsoidea C-169]|uniref:Uncharacterized protein n=1 Tax=Coccomyxa subellipsoidea (strain C-169) TaxID=574566 RepID=I0YQ80_COCSC|nr:hypothetical protein COCSUDRAFT_34004 [Coccomyxa subellipsoidea C-169]EIE20549.1 hypothetical protein COCSUDRAFT_34004 [Coccomyxa subellipsoidea C-169]|eukprot:XP_005645093.1 hypothetical protein COCSUDRAFT_34004 [Coccomyxa subellipsoidea C-169]
MLHAKILQLACLEDPSAASGKSGCGSVIATTTRSKRYHYEDGASVKYSRDGFETFHWQFSFLLGSRNAACVHWSAQ